MTSADLERELEAIWPLAQKRARQLLGTERDSRPILAWLADPIRGEPAFTLVDLVAFVWVQGVYEAGLALAKEDERKGRHGSSDST